MLCGVQYDDVINNVNEYSAMPRCEYAVVTPNRKSVALIEVKYVVYLHDIVKVANGIKDY